MYAESVFRLRFFIFVSMNTDISFFIGGTVLFAVLINVFLYFYHKYRRIIFFRYLDGRHYTIIENVETNIESYSKFGSKLTYLKDEIFIIHFNRPILQLISSSEIFPSVSPRFKISFKEIHNDILKIKGDTSLGNFKISLNFKNKNFDLHSVV